MKFKLIQKKKKKHRIICKSLTIIYNYVTIYWEYFATNYIKYLISVKYETLVCFNLILILFLAETLEITKLNTLDLMLLFSNLWNYNLWLLWI